MLIPKVAYRTVGIVCIICAVFNSFLKIEIPNYTIYGGILTLGGLILLKLTEK